MGIKGLMGYVGSNNYFFNDLQMRNTKLIIDGNNLYHALYFDSGLEQMRGGNYDCFTEVLHKFFGNLAMCDIHAYVVLDGGCDISDNKLETQKQRAKDRILMAHNLSKGESGKLLPLLMRDVFTQVLTKLRVPFVQCFSEADREIVVLANAWNCPVLTFDSDFCIFDIKAGYCPLIYFQWKNVVTFKGGQDCYIPARCFLAWRFCNYFKNMNMSLLPLFAVLSGNDYISLPDLETFFIRVHLPASTNFRGGRKHVRIHGLLNWLSSFSNSHEALDNVVKYLNSHVQVKIRALLYSAMEEYDLSGVPSLVSFFQSGSYNAITAIKLNLPNWIQGALARGQLPPLLSDALVLRRTFLHVQVEAMRKPSAHFITQPIRQVMYGLLLNLYQPLKLGVQTNQHANVVEFDRLETSLRKTSVEAIVSSRNFSEDLSLQNLPEVSLATRLTLFLDTLGVSMSTLESVPHHHRLTIATICYWVVHADPKVRLHHLKALLMGIVYGEACEMLTKPESQGDDIRQVEEQLSRIKQKYGGIPSAEDLHVFCQWQCCLQAGLRFNNLLCTPLKQPDVTRIYNGCLVHQLSQKLKSPSATENLFSTSPVLQKLYQDFLQTVRSSLPADFFQSRSCNSKSSATKTTEKTNVTTKMDSQSMCDVNNRFAGLFLEE
ncbi:single-strand DNA endonuclease ASTE1 [Pelodytes ibericus]